MEFKHARSIVQRSLQNTALAWLMLYIYCSTSGRAAPSFERTSRMRFSDQPTEEEIELARAFDEPLIPVGLKPTGVENRWLADALSGYANRKTFDDLSSITSYVERFPSSPWNGSLLLHLGVEFYNYGYYSRALDAWERSWLILKDSSDPKGKSQADRSLGELARMYSKLGRMVELTHLISSVSNRPLNGPATQLIDSAKQALWLMEHQPGICFKCGPLALEQILSDQNPMAIPNPLIFQAQSTTNGFSLYQVSELSSQLGMSYQAAYRSPGGPWVVPAVVHWKLGHYAAVLRQDGDRFLIKDHTFQSSLWVSASALEQESSGYFLIPRAKLSNGWTAVSADESRRVWGRGTITGLDHTQTGTGSYVTQSGGSPWAGSICALNPASPNTPSGTPGDASGSGNPAQSAGCSSCQGMTTYTMDTMLASLSLNDTPVGYRPPVGPWIEFTATYDQNEANQPATFSYSNLGQKWTFNWISYITDNPGSPGADLTYLPPGGGTLTFTGFNSSTKAYSSESMTQAILVMTSSSSYEMQFRSGLKYEFTNSNGAIGSTRLIFLTQIVDPAGNAVNLTYDSSLRITNITDAIGQATVFSYSNSSFPNAITSVTDPFGRSAGFQYNTTGMLTQITDVLGLKSQFVYGANEFITNLVTPYGVTTFTTGTINGGPWLQVTDPLGESELVQAPLNGLGTPASDPAATVPTNMPVVPYNQYMNVRNSFYWDKHAYLMGAGNVVLAKIYHFCHVGVSPVEGGALESVKEPLENRVWFDYPNQPQGNVFGTQSIDRPSAIARVLDDGSTQLRLFQYNALGRVTNSTDPLGRTFSYIYATNNVDLLQVIMTSHGRSELQASVTYNAQHRPLTITDAAGQTTTNAYNSRGQILSTINPMGNKTTFSYDSNGYLLTITGPLQTTNDVTSFTHDSFGRIQTVTDPVGYVLSYTYDAMDRPTRIGYPDGTYEQLVYSNLDLVASSDRLGRWTTNTYNAIRQLIQTRDPLGRTVQFQYCECGALLALIDAAGNATWWKYDAQDRVTGKYYADGSGITYAYENTTSQLHLRTDEKGQQTYYQYFIDDNLENISYPNATIATAPVSYTYDTNYNRLVTMHDGIGTTLYSYNPITSPPSIGAGQLASVSGPLPNSQVTYQYDALDRVISRAINGVAQTTSFDPIGRPTVMTNALGTFRYTYADVTPRLLSEAYPNGQTNLYSYYGNLGDQRLQRCQRLYPNGSLLSAAGYAYNAIGQITAWTNQWDAVPTRAWFPSYDAVDQLTNVMVQGGASSLTNFAYVYDIAGNRILAATNGVQNQSYYNSLNQLVGSSVTIPNVTYEWDAENRLTAINQGTNRSEFSYDGMGRRVAISEKANGAIVTNSFYLWCGSEICEIRDSTGANVVRRLFSQGEILLDGGLNPKYFYTRDHLGSVREAVDSNGTLVSRYDYDPFGQKNVMQEAFPTTFGFTGHFLHRESTLHLSWFRALNSSYGRWISRDPLGEQSAANLYTYAGNNPISMVDIYGLKERERLPNDPPPYEHPFTATPCGPNSYNDPRSLCLVANREAYNCHAYAWHGGNWKQGGAIFPKWEDDPSRDVSRAQSLLPDEPNLVGDRIEYYNNMGQNTHSGIVTEVDSSGNAIRITSKWGEGPIYDHFPSDVPGKYGTVRRYFRNNETK